EQEISLLARPRQPFSGTLAFNSSSHTVASESLGARQSPLGERDPPEPTFGPLGMQLLLNWLVRKNRKTKTSSHFFTAWRSYSFRLLAGSRSGHDPRFLSLQAWCAR